MNRSRKNPKYRFGMLVMLFILFLLMSELATSRSITTSGILFIFAFAQAGLIIWDYMHVGRLFSARKEAEPEDGQP